jgi:hypothetical protein
MTLTTAWRWCRYLNFLLKLLLAALLRGIVGGVLRLTLDSSWQTMILSYQKFHVCALEYTTY